MVGVETPVLGREVVLYLYPPSGVWSDLPLRRVMWILRISGIVLVIVLTSFYFFPFEFTFLPGINTKMAMAGFGLVLLAFQLARQRESLISRDIFQLSLWAGLASLIGWISITYNNTPDTAYATYIVSMWVWLSAAYVAVTWIRWVHGTVSVFIVCNYLIALCVMQCVLALGMDFYAPLKQLVYSILDEGTVAFMEKKNRLMGLGVGLDVAGSRFSAVLIMIPFICLRYRQKVIDYLPLYILSFVIICVIGNMIAFGVITPIFTYLFYGGELKVSFYGSEQDKMNDGKLDRDGIAQHKKKCAFRMWNTRPPRIGIYVPQGAKFETAYAKGALGSLKACGYDYFFLPPTPEFGGDAQSAFLEAAGDQLVCPRLKRSPDDKQGCDLGPEHIRIIMKALMDSEKSNKSSAEEMIKFKMRLVGELNTYLTNVKPNDDKLEEERDKIESDIRLEMYTTATFPALTSFIEKGINGELKDANGNPVKWDRVDLACAYEALGRISEGISNGQIKYDYLHGNSSEQMLQLLGAEMNKCRAEVVNEFNNKFNKGGEDNNEEPENRTNSRLKTSSGEALAVYEDRMNKRFEKISKKGSDFAKKLKFSNKEKSIDAPSYDKQTKKIINRPIPGIAQTNTPTPTRGGYTRR